MRHAQDRVREITARERLLLPVEDIVQDLNGYLRGWGWRPICRGNVVGVASAVW